MDAKQCPVGGRRRSHTGANLSLIVAYIIPQSAHPYIVAARMGFNHSLFTAIVILIEMGVAGSQSRRYQQRKQTCNSRSSSILLICSLLWFFCSLHRNMPVQNMEMPNIIMTSSSYRLIQKNTNEKRNARHIQQIFVLHAAAVTAWTIN